MKYQINIIISGVFCIFLASCGKDEAAAYFDEAQQEGEKIIAAIQKNDTALVYTYLDDTWAADSSPEALNKELSLIYANYGYPSKPPFVDVKQMAEEDFPKDAAPTALDGKVIEVYAPMETDGTGENSADALDVRLSMIETEAGYRLYDWSFTPVREGELIE